MARRRKRLLVVAVGLVSLLAACADPMGPALEERPAARPTRDADSTQVHLPPTDTWNPSNYAVAY